MDLPRRSNPDLRKSRLGRHAQPIVARAIRRTRQLLEPNDDGALVAPALSAARAHQILVAAPALARDLAEPPRAAAAADPPAEVRVARAHGGAALARRVEAALGVAVLVLGLLVAAVLEQGAEHDGVGGEGCDEDVEGGEEGAVLLAAEVVDDGGDLVKGEDYAEEGEGHADYNGGFAGVGVSGGFVLVNGRG